MAHDWSKEDAATARAQGWGVYDVWDGRMIYEIQRDMDSNIFLTDEAARAWVKARSELPAQDNTLARKAILLVFQSKIGKNLSAKN